MDPDQRQLTDLVAELRERLRLFAGRLPGGPANRRDPGPLDVAERLALTARVLAEGLVSHGGPESAEVAASFRELAGALEAVPIPLAGSEVASSLDELVQVMDDLACAWDRRGQADLPLLWSRVRAAGDLVWSPEARGESVPPAELEPVPDPDTDEIWLLVTGAFRRGTLEHRLRTAGFSVVGLTDTEQVVGRLSGPRPVAVICDDAAPGRYHHRLRSLLPATSPPLVLVRAGCGDSVASAPAWTPPYRSEDLLALLR